MTVLPPLSRFVNENLGCGPTIAMNAVGVSGKAREQAEVVSNSLKCIRIAKRCISMIVERTPHSSLNRAASANAPRPNSH